MGRHHLRPRWPTHAARATIAATIAAATWWAVTVLPVDQAPAAGTGPVFTATEQRYINELAEAGVPLAPSAQVVAVQIANAHVAHKHLTGMRAEIRQDFRTRIGGLSEEQVHTAQVALEHYFTAMTGKKQ